ncbi:MAG: PAS domain S-box protein [Gammaproteobacteria bacterium]|nr:PAS domain S-box protein [Gammaproteobacteria bacterium]
MKQSSRFKPDFRALFESAPACYLVLRTDLTIAAVSDAYLKATMTKREKILGRGLFDVFPDNPADPAATGVSNLSASLQRVLKNKLPDTMAVQKYDIRRPESAGGGFEERYWSPVNSPVFNDRHEITYIIHRVEDVTEFVRLKQAGVEQHRATEALKLRAERMETELFLRAQELQNTNKRLLDSEIFLDSIIENLPNMVFVKEANELRFVLFNKAGERLLGYPRTALVGKNDYDFFPKEQADHFVCNDRKVLQNGKLLDIPEEPIQTRTQGIRFLHTKKIPIMDSDGRGRYLLGISEDITERKAAEERFHAVAETANDALIIADQQGNILYFNNAAERCFGYRRDELIGKPLSLLMPARFHAAHLAGFKHFLATGESRVVGKTVELTGQRKNAEEFPLELSLASWKVAENSYFTGIARDITQQRAALDALRASEERFRILVEGVQDYAIFMLHADGRVASWNLGAERIKGYSAAEIVGRHFSQFYLPDDVAQGKPLRELACAAANGRVEAEGWRLRKDGSRFWANTVIAALYDSQGKLRGFSKVTRDVTEQRAIEQRVHDLNRHLQSRNAELVAVNHELEAFSYSVSHDLRAPLRAIDGFSREVLESYADRLDAKGQGYLQRVRAASQRMGELIDDLLKLARITRTELQRSEVDLSTLAQEIFSEQRSRVPTRQIEMSIAPRLPASADPNLIRVALENLLSNADKFTARSERARIEVGSLQQDDEQVFFVRDNGAGFDMAYADKLFCAFQRLHGANEFEGTGIGLATVQRIIHRHGGRIWAQAQVNSGATFFFTLPT